MEKAPVPYSPVLHSLASVSTIAWLIHQKFELGIPLYRQEKEWEALGLCLNRATMSNSLLVVYRVSGFSSLLVFGNGAHTRYLLSVSDSFNNHDM